MAPNLFVVATEMRALCDMEDTLSAISTNDDPIAPL
jgi:hypothetical protein